MSDNKRISMADQGWVVVDSDMKMISDKSHAHTHFAIEEIKEHAKKQPVGTKKEYLIVQSFIVERS